MDAGAYPQSSRARAAWIHRRSAGLCCDAGNERGLLVRPDRSDGELGVRDPDVENCNRDVEFASSDGCRNGHRAGRRRRAGATRHVAQSRLASWRQNNHAPKIEGPVAAFYNLQAPASANEVGLSIQIASIRAI